MSATPSEIAVTILGSGTCVPSLHRSSCSVLMETGGQRLLFDSGPGTMRRLLETGTTIADISYLCYSHFHPDHTGELVPFLFASKYPAGRGRSRPLWLLGGRGFRNFYEGLKAVYGHWIELSPEVFSLRELDGDPLGAEAFDHFDLAFAAVAHSPESLAYRVTSRGGRTVVYSGDTDLSDNLVQLAHRADLLICEAAVPDGSEVPGHLTPSRAGDMASRAEVGALVLTHFYPECEATDIIGQCRRTYRGPLVLAEDHMRIRLDADGTLRQTEPS